MNRLLLAAAMAVLAIAIGEASAAPTLLETFESYDVPAPLPNPPWYYDTGAGGSFNVVDGYTTDATHVAQVTEKYTSNYIMLDLLYPLGRLLPDPDAGGIMTLYPLDQGILYFEFDIADGGTRHGEEIVLYGPTWNDRLLDLYAVQDFKGFGGYTLGIESWGPAGANVLDTMAPDQWYHVKLTLDLGLHTISGEVDGSPKFSGFKPQYAVWSPITRVGWQTFPANDYGAGATYWDNLKLQMKCFAAVEPHDAPQTVDLAVDPAPAPSHQVAYTVDNVGLDALTYTVETVDKAGQAHDYPWLSLDKTGGSLASGEVNTVTATIASCASAGPTAYLKFSHCGGLSEIRQIDLVVPWPSGCNSPLADADGDGDVDQADFAMLQICYTGANLGPIQTTPQYCACMDFGDDNLDGMPDYDDDIDQFDVSAFEVCASGPGVPADPCCQGGSN